MMNNNDDTAHLEDAELLLPWYVSGKLNAADQQKVETWLNDNPEAKAHLERVTEEQHIAITGSEALGLPRADAIDRLMADIGQNPNKSPKTAGIFTRFWDSLSPRYAIAGFAALALVIVAQSTTIGMMMAGQPTTIQTASYETASGPRETLSGPTALVVFQQDKSLTEIAAYLSKNDLRIVDGPKPGNVFQIAHNLGATDTDAANIALETLGADTSMVSFFALAN